MSQELIAEITAGLAKVIGTDSGFGSILKFDYEGAGVTRVDGKNVPNSVTNEDGPADCTIVISAENLMKMFKRELDPTMAFMQGKMKVNGDMAVAMKLGPILQKAAAAAGVEFAPYRDCRKSCAAGLDAA